MSTGKIGEGEVMIDVRVSEDPIDLSLHGWAGATQPGFGASNSFFGVVRNRNHGKDVLSVSYDAFVPLAEKTLRIIAEEGLLKFGPSGSVLIRHRTGNLKVGEVSVLILVHTPHRAEAFALCRYVIEELKVRAPIWKKEFYTNGETDWLKGHALCRH